MDKTFDSRDWETLSFLDLQTEYGSVLTCMWEDQIQKHPETAEDEIIKRGYAIESKLQIGGVLFLGMNPSFPQGEKNQTGRYFYDWDENNDYFKAFSAFSELTFGKVYPCHHDIFFIRHTDQKTLLNKRNDNSYKDFFDKQLNISKSIIRRTDPRLIVILNARVRDIFHEIYPFDELRDFDDSLGAYRLEIEGKNVPVIFSGMLSGQRALDRGSKMNLRWQIKHVLQMY